MKDLKVCGHRLEPRHFIKISKLARKWRIKDAEALRRLIEQSKV